MTHFINENLHDRSFKNQSLIRMNFRGATIRGCDFSGAVLSGADFSEVKAGLSIRQKLYLGALTIIVVIGVGDAVSRLVFGTIGQSPLDPNATYIPMLYLIANLTAISSFAAAIAQKPKRRRTATIATGILAGAIVGFAAGFFYPSLILHGFEFYTPQSNLIQVLKDLDANRTTIATRTTIAGAFGLLALSAFQHRTSFKVAISIAGAIVSYGATFLWGAVAGAFFGNQNSGLGILFSILTVALLAMTTVSVLRIIDELTHAIGTSFRGADLTGAKFDYADLRNTDFSKAIGYFTPRVK